MQRNYFNTKSHGGQAAWSSANEEDEDEPTYEELWESIHPNWTFDEKAKNANMQGQKQTKFTCVQEGHD